MKEVAIVVVLFAGLVAAAQSKPDEEAIRKILDDEVTNERGMLYTGRQEFRDRDDVIFKGPMHGTMLQVQPVSLRFLTPDVAISETLT